MNLNDFIRASLEASRDVKAAMVSACGADLETAARILWTAVADGHTIFWCGNGGSAADAQHLSTELMGGLRDHDRNPVPSVALTTDTSFLTAWSNDTAYETVFSRQVEGLAQSGDVLVAISTSGNSANVLAAIQTARQQGLKIIGFTGRSGGQMAGGCDVCIRIPSDDTQRIQEGHILSGHILCEWIEKQLLD
ncbi:MAG: SIS domain-containing protein [Candidatus Neomarinimicrobiota bacterium]|nr:MAG: SIS domain-containing protein [Candidatus Neomarinimicrobiota bacterium]